MSTARRPETDGQTERNNRTVENVLRHFISSTMIDWDQDLSLVQFAINNAWQEIVRETPHFLNFGRHPRTPLTIGLPSAQPTAKNPAELASEMQQLTARANKFMFAAQQRQKHYCDIKRSEAVYQVGAQLLLSTVGLKLKVLSVSTEKLQPKRVGPFACVALGTLPTSLTCRKQCVFMMFSMSHY